MAVGTIHCMGTAPVRPQTVPQPTYQVPEVQWGEYGASASPTLWTYAPAAQTRNPITSDGVAVSVAPVIADNAVFESYRDVLVECRGPDNQPFYSSVVGFGVQLAIENQTGHIITTERSALQIEDGQANAWPLIRGDWREWVPLVLSKIRARYQGYRDALTAYEASTRHAMDAVTFVPDGYPAEYARYEAEYRRCIGSFQGYGPTESIVVERCGSPEEVASRAPDGLRASFRARAEEGLRAKVAEATARIAELEQACTAAVEERARQPNIRLVTEETFERMRILPGQRVAAYIPLDANFGRTGPELVHLRLYDLVTATDAAGNPTRRTHFDFRLERTAQRP